MKRWQDVNALRKPDRAPIWCKPCKCWEELIPADSLVCRDPWLRGFEMNFRRIICKREIDDDQPVEEYFPVNTVFEVDPPNTWGVEIGRHESSEDGGAWGYDPPLKEEKDFDRLQSPVYTYNKQRTQDNFDRTAELLDDILPVKLVCSSDTASATIGYPAADLRGMSEMMMDMAAEPRLMHRLMSYLTDNVMKKLDAIEATGLLSLNNNGPMACSDFFGPEPVDNQYSLKNCWCFGNSQEFDQVGPEMWEEFSLEYQKKLFKRFGQVAYGCCENLTTKIDGVLSIPNLRIFVSSAWTDLDRVIEKTGRDYCIMWRQKASDVVFPESTDSIRKHLMTGAEKLQNSSYQIVLRELQTLSGHSDRLHVWTRLAKQAAEKYCS